MGALGKVVGGQEREKKQREGKALGEAAGGRGAARPPQAGPRAKLVAFGGAEWGCAPFGARAAGAAGWAKAGCFVMGGVFWACGGGGERGLVRAGVRVSAGQERERKQREEKALGEGRGRGAARPPQAGPRAKLVAFGGAERGCAPFCARRAQKTALRGGRG